MNCSIKRKGPVPEGKRPLYWISNLTQPVSMNYKNRHYEGKGCQILRM